MGGCKAASQLNTATFWANWKTSQTTFFTVTRTLMWCTQYMFDILCYYIVWRTVIERFLLHGTDSKRLLQMAFWLFCIFCFVIQWTHIFYFTALVSYHCVSLFMLHFDKFEVNGKRSLKLIHQHFDWPIKHLSRWCCVLLLSQLIRVESIPATYLPREDHGAVVCFNLAFKHMPPNQTLLRFKGPQNQKVWKLLA